MVAVISEDVGIVLFAAVACNFSSTIVYILYILQHFKNYETQKIEENPKGVVCILLWFQYSIQAIFYTATVLVDKKQVFVALSFCVFYAILYLANTIEFLIVWKSGLEVQDEIYPGWRPDRKNRRELAFDLYHKMNKALAQAEQRRTGNTVVLKSVEQVRTEPKPLTRVLILQAEKSARDREYSRSIQDEIIYIGGPNDTSTDHSRNNHQTLSALYASFRLIPDAPNTKVPEVTVKTSSVSTPLLDPKPENDDEVGVNPNSTGLECNVCMLPYSTQIIPRMLIGCGHTVCQECAQNLVQYQKILCPFCRKYTDVWDGVKGLPKNFAVLEMIQDQKG